MNILSTSTILKKFFKNILNDSRGFTLIELLVTVGIIVIMSIVVAPNVMQWLPNYRLKSAANNLYSNMQSAKLMALKKNSNVIIIFTPAVYSPAGGAGSYKIFIDNAPDFVIPVGGGAINPGAEDEVIVQASMPKNVTLFFDSFGNNVTGFNARGLPWKNSWGNVQIRNNNSRYYKITLFSAGSIQIKTSNDGAAWF